MCALQLGPIFDHPFIRKQVEDGRWREDVVPPAVTGMPRPLRILWARRDPKSIIKWAWHGDKETFCPPKWADIAIGSGACGYGCRACFLMLTHRVWRNPWAPVVYDNYEDFVAQVRAWLLAKEWAITSDLYPKGKKAVRRSNDSIGLGIDCAASLLLEGLTGQLRRVAPLFASPETNPRRNPLVLLTKSANVQYLDPLVKEGQTHSVVVTFSLNPEPIADLWEGKYQDGLRITPPIAERLRAMREAQRMGFEVRARIDPILPAPGWPEMYRAFFHDMAAQGLRPTQLTRGTYRSKNTQLDHWREAWGLPPMEYAPEAVAKEGTHNHLVGRLDIYHEIQQAVREAWHPTGWQPWVSLCKETFGIRKEAGMRNGECNCLCAQRRPQSATSHDARLGLSGMQRPIVYG